MFQTQTRTTCFILGVVKWGKKKGGGSKGDKSRGDGNYFTINRLVLYLMANCWF